MGFRQGSFAKVWRLEDKGNYHIAEMSISRKIKDSNDYEVEWSNKFVRLVGHAHNQAKNLDTSKSVKIAACDVTNKYIKEKNETYTNYVIFEFDTENSASQGGNQSNKSNRPAPSQAIGDGFMNIPDGLDEELPFN